MRYGYWMPVFGGWLRNVDDENMAPTWEYNKRLAVRSEQIGFDLSLVAEPGMQAALEKLNPETRSLADLYEIGENRAPAEPCRAALKAARAAASAMAARNLERAGRGEQEIAFGLALHLGEVTYGNIGAKNRLDFTVIGAPVNEVCRVEALTRTLGVDVLLTQTFVRVAELTGARSLGRHTLKGVTQPQEVFLPPDVVQSDR